MKILFTGGGTGGHFYPIIAVAQEIHDISEKEKLIPPKLYFMSNHPYDERALFENDIQFVRTSAGKIRNYFSILNITDLFKTGVGVLKALFSIYSIYPDVIFGKGGYASFPAIFAGRILRIPIIIHESDSSPGKVNKWAAKFASRIAVSFPSAAEYFPKGKAVHTGHPIRGSLLRPITEGAYEFLKLEEGVPVVVVLGGSQGAQIINDALLDSLLEILPHCQIIHQTGEKNFNEVSKTADVILTNSELKKRYHPFPYLNELALRMIAGVSSLIITRAGSTLFEIASWGIPAIVIPIPESVSHDQTKNAFGYARAGAGIVIEEKNLSPVILRSQLQKLLDDKVLREEMKKSAAVFSQPDAARKIAREILSIGLSHEV